MRFFFYGTLLDSDVMALVLGRRLPPSAFVPARLTGYARRRVKGFSYPILLPDPRGTACGVAVGGLSSRDVARLVAYEGPRYRIGRVRVKVDGTLKPVSVFEPVEHRFVPTDGAWDLALWQRRAKRAFVERLRRAFTGPPVQVEATHAPLPRGGAGA
jgi:hypothetical protein